MMTTAEPHRPVQPLLTGCVTLESFSEIGRSLRRILVAALALALLSIGLAPAGAQDAVLCDGQVATIVGTPGDDTLIGTEDADVIVGLQGIDLIQGLGGDDVICGGIGADTIYGGAGFDIIFGAQGNDYLYAANGGDDHERQDTRGSRMFGGTGHDTLIGSNRWDRMQGGQGQDALFGNEGRDWLRAGSGNDVIDGGPGKDDIHGGSGRDELELDAGDIARGGSGKDECFLVGKPARLLSCEKVHEQQVIVPEPEPQFPNEAPSLEAGEFEYEHFSGTAWSGVIHGLVPVGQGQLGGLPGDCYLIVGELTPTWIKRGNVTNPSEAPDFLILAGELMYPEDVCDTSSAEMLGYQSARALEVPLDVTVPFYESVLVFPGPSPITKVVFGNEADFQLRMTDPVYLDSVPAFAER